MGRSRPLNRNRCAISTPGQAPGQALSPGATAFTHFEMSLFKSPLPLREGAGGGVCARPRANGRGHRTRRPCRFATVWADPSRENPLPRARGSTHLGRALIASPACGRGRTSEGCPGEGTAALPKHSFEASDRMIRPCPETLVLASPLGGPHPVSLREPDLSRKRERQSVRTPDLRLLSPMCRCRSPARGGGTQKRRYVNAIAPGERYRSAAPLSSPRGEGGARSRQRMGG